jgi:hypothetical protein
MLIAIDGTGAGTWELSNLDGSLPVQGRTEFPAAQIQRRQPGLSESAQPLSMRP